MIEPNRYTYTMKSFFSSFGFKIFLFVGLMLVLLLGLNTWYNLHLHEQEFMQEVRLWAEQVAESVQYATRIHLEEKGKKRVQATLIDLAQRVEGIESIRIFDINGQIRSSTIPEERGQNLEKKSSHCLICHPRTGSTLPVPHNGQIQVRQDKNSDHRILRLTNIIYNEESCFLKCHQAHPRGQKVLGIFEITMSLQSVEAKIKRNKRYLIQFSILSFFFIMTNLGILLFYFLIRPVNALLKGVKNLSIGRFNVEIPVYSQDEFGRLSHSLNNMIGKLSKEVAYRHFLLYDNISPEDKDEVNETEKDDNPFLDNDKSDLDNLGQDEVGSSFEDIYERIHDETHMKVVRSVKLASLGQLSAGIAHELNNPLTAVLSYSSLLLEKAKVPKEKEWLTIIVEESKRCRNIVAALLEFARQSTPEKADTQVNDIVERAISLLKNKESFHNIHIIKKLDPDLFKVRVDRGQIYQVFTNLLINAADAMEGKGTLIVESRAYTLESKISESRQFVEISFSDTGCGIPEENMERLFDPFFTTKGPTMGTGLGLSICFGIIKRHHGNITVRSKVGEGSTFIIHLPVDKEDANGED